jgi:glycosyltransferase involved in cell wall biosynthesis
MKFPWACSQIGSREHYSIPRVLAAEGALAFLLTDFWNDYPGWVQRTLPESFKRALERTHPELEGQTIVHLGLGRFRFEVTARARKWDAWETILQRNAYFQRQMLKELAPLAGDLEARAPGVFFSYSYAAARLFPFFRERGWHCVLGQIDPAREEEELVLAETEAHPDFADAARRAPPEYWELWEKECALADRIVVNSAWSARALERQGVDAAKVRVVPLAYEGPAADPDAALSAYPDRFSAERPLRLLYLGQIIPRKGVRLLLEAFLQLGAAPVELWMVGPRKMEVPASYLEHPRIHWTGAVSRSEAEAQYAQADCFVLPTLSDGFAITQLEAQARQVPVLASRFCGEVVRSGENGRVLDPLSTETLAATLRECLEKPVLLENWARASAVAPEFSLGALRANLAALEDELVAAPPA